MWVGPTSNRLSMNASFIGGTVGLNASGNSGPGPGLSFRYEGGEPLLGGVRRHERRLREVKGRAYVYCTLNMYQTNPVPLQTSATAPGLQIVSFGYDGNGEFIPAVRFGLQDGKGLAPELAQLVPWVFDGRLDYYGAFARPNVPYEFKIELDLERRRMTVQVGGRGDDNWFLLAEDVPFIKDVSTINVVRVEQHPGAQGVQDLVFQLGRSTDREVLRASPLGKPKRVVRPNDGFTFQSMRSMWRQPGRHVTVSRDQNRWQGFPDVVHIGSGKLIAAYCDGRGHGGGGKSVIRVSKDHGKTWGSEKVMVPSRGSCERVQRLRDGSILYISGEKLPTVDFHQSTDDGETWKRVGGFDIRNFGLKIHYPLSHVLERSNGDWLVTGSDTYPISKEAVDSKNRFRIRERMQVFRSKDKGKTWELLSLIDSYPSSGHAGSESSILELPSGKLVIYARESRNDGLPGFRVFSDDQGKTWSDPEDLPIQVMGRVKAGFLSDGRVLLTTRTGIGRSALWGWLEDPNAAPSFRINGAHFNDHFSKGLKHGALYIDNDGQCGQFTRYYLRPPAGPESHIELIAEVMVRENLGRAATISIPFAGRLRIFADRLDFVGSEVISVQIAPGRFHTYRILSRDGRMQLHVDGELKMETSKLDNRRVNNDWSSVIASPLLFSFGNEPDPIVYPLESTAKTSIVPLQITAKVTGLSIWKSVEARVTDPNRPVHRTKWVAAYDRFPDQYQLDHVFEVDASVSGWDQGYSGWTELPDGRIFIVNYTDDTAVAWPASGPSLSRCPWIRGTYVLSSELPRRTLRN